MNVTEIALTLGIFIIAMYAGISFTMSFNQKPSIPKEITQAWEGSVSQIDEAKAIILDSVNKIRSGGLTAVVGLFSLAFGGIFYIVVSLWSVFVTIPATVFSAINYLGSVFHVPSEIITIVISIITILVTIKAIEFVTGRSL